MQNGDKLTVGTAKVTIVDKLGDRAKFKSEHDIEVRLAEIPQDPAGADEYLNRVVLWATKYYEGVAEAKKAGGAVNPRQIKKDKFTEVFGAVESAKPKAVVRIVKPETVSAPVMSEELKADLDPKELAKRFDTFKSEDLPDSAKQGADDLPPLMEGEDELLGQAHVVGEDVLKDVATALPDIGSLGDGADFFQ